MLYRAEDIQKVGYQYKTSLSTIALFREKELM